MSYRRIQQIEFNHCDPAGLVFYPRYFEMANSVIENFFADEIGRSFAQIHLEGAKTAVPTVHIEADFIGPLRLGDRVEFTLVVRRVGGSSAVVEIMGSKEGETRLRLRLTLVWVENMKPKPWPEAIRARLVAHLEDSL